MQLNTPPELEQPASQIFTVGVAGSVSLRGSDADGDPVSYRFEVEPEPPSQLNNDVGRPRLDSVTDGAIFSWTPSHDDLKGMGRFDYRVRFFVEDGRGGSVKRVAIVSVVGRQDPRMTALRFVEPDGQGVLVNADCLEGQPVRVVGHAANEGGVSLSVEGPDSVMCTESDELCERPVLLPDGPGAEKTMRWCPGLAQRADMVHFPVHLTARRLGGDEGANRPFFVRFRHQSAAGCPGERPTIMHEEPTLFMGPLDYVISAEIDDDFAFKAPPVLAYVIDPDVVPTSLDDSGTWKAAAFNLGEEGKWSVAIPNLGLGPQESARIHYVIVATDNDDLDSVQCDHTTESQVFTFEAIGGEMTGDSAYGLCEPCTRSSQCGSVDDLCVSVNGQSFCAVTCTNQEDCGESELCMRVDSTEGNTQLQCLPADLDCGQICTPDGFESGSGNDTAEQAVPLTPGLYEDLTVCTGDRDFYQTTVEAGQSVRVRAFFDGRRGDLDIGLMLPDEQGLVHQSVEGNTNLEEVAEPCVPTSGIAYVAVWPFEGSENDYSLEIEVGQGDCNRPCTPDPFDAREGGNDTPENASSIELPWEGRQLTICPEDVDLFAFELEAGQLVSVSLDFDRNQGDLGVRLGHGDDVVAESASFRSNERVEFAAPVDGVYTVEVFGNTQRTLATYSLSVELLAGAGCGSSRECPAGSVCDAGMCRHAVCDEAGACGDDQLCVRPRISVDDGPDGGDCAARCENLRDCRSGDGYVCKYLTELDGACLLEGPQGVGQRCNRNEDCSGGQACLALSGGYCAQIGCEPGSCPEGTACESFEGHAVCLSRCGGDGDCRVAEGYSCRQGRAGNGRVCLPLMRR